MPTVTISVEPEVLDFYTQIARAMDMDLDQVLSDALFRLAGELSLTTLYGTYAAELPEYFS